MPLFKANGDYHSNPQLNRKQRSRDWRSPTPTDISISQLLHLCLREHCRKGCRKILKSEYRMLTCKTISPRNGCIKQSWNDIISGHVNMERGNVHGAPSLGNKWHWKKENYPFIEMSRHIGCPVQSNQPSNHIHINNKNGLNKFYLYICLHTYTHIRMYICIYVTL